MICFEKGELEIAMVTYNRCKFVKEWIINSYEELVKRNIHLSIYDSSTNTETENYVIQFNQDRDVKIEYIRIASETEIGYKPMLPIFNSKAKYVWVSGDSRRHDFGELDEKVFPYLKQDIDYILLDMVDKVKENKFYLDKSEFLRDCFTSSTCIGMSIYKRSIFECLKNDEKWLQQCDLKYRHNYGFGWLGYFFEVYANGNYKAMVAKVKVINYFLDKKKQTWAARWYECWLDNLCDLLDKLPECYENKELVPQVVWEDMQLVNHAIGYSNRMLGHWNREGYQKYKKSGLLSRVTQKSKLVTFYSCAPMWLVKVMYSFVSTIHPVDNVDYVKNACKKSISIIKKNCCEKNIVIWGAWQGGVTTREMLEKKGFTVTAFVDRDKDKKHLYSDIMVKLPEEINVDKDYVVVCTLKHYQGIEDYLKEKNYQKGDYMYLPVNKN